jgi:protein-L-isoaspartate(D-aspartate) O-methyltransferase
MDFSAARTNMVESQVRTNDVTDLDIQGAMRRVARERFCAPGRAFSAYAEVEPEIAPGRFLMRPRDVAKLLQLAHPRPGETALAIAAPYAAAVLASIGLKVTAQESDPKIAALLGPVLDDYGVELTTADLAKPAKNKAGYDLIVCEAAVRRAPDAWLAALSDRGRLAAVERDGPVGRGRLWMRTAAGASHGGGFDATPPYLPGFEPEVVFQF